MSVETEYKVLHRLTVLLPAPKIFSQTLSETWRRRWDTHTKHHYSFQLVGCKNWSPAASSDNVSNQCGISSTTNTTASKQQKHRQKPKPAGPFNATIGGEVLLNVLRCQLTYYGQVETNAEARFKNSLRPRKPEGSLGRTAQDVHLDSHTAPELW